jgi:TonB family protein
MAHNLTFLLACTVGATGLAGPTEQERFLRPYCTDARSRLHMNLHDRTQVSGGQHYADPRPTELLGQKVQDASRRLGLEGSLFLGIVVNRGGTLYDVSMVESSGQPDLDKEAIHIFRTGQYTPGSVNGVPSSFCAVFKVIFKLAR